MRLCVDAGWCWFDGEEEERTGMRRSWVPIWWSVGSWFMYRPTNGGKGNARVANGLAGCCCEAQFYEISNAGCSSPAYLLACPYMQRARPGSKENLPEQRTAVRTTTRVLNVVIVVVRLTLFTTRTGGRANSLWSTEKAVSAAIGQSRRRDWTPYLCARRRKSTTCSAGSQTRQ